MWVRKFNVYPSQTELGVGYQSLNPLQSTLSADAEECAPTTNQGNYQRNSRESLTN